MSGTNISRRDQYVLLHGDYAIEIERRQTENWHVMVCNPISGEEVSTETDTLEDAVVLSLMIAGELQDEWEGR